MVHYPSDIRYLGYSWYTFEIRKVVDREVVYSILYPWPLKLHISVAAAFANSAYLEEYRWY